MRRSEIFHKKPWSIAAFDEPHLPAIVGRLQDKTAFSSRVGEKFLLFMDMPIYLPGKGWQIPKELEQFREAIVRAVECERMINPHFDQCKVYLTIDQRTVNPGESQRRTGWHSDSYINVETRFGSGSNSNLETDAIYLASDVIPTRFCGGPFPFGDLDPNDTERVLQHFENGSLGKEVVTYPSYTLVRMGPECVHQVGFNTSEESIARTFLKITFSRQILNREGNGINHLFDVNWPMYPRNADKRNHSSIVGYHPGAEEFREVTPTELVHMVSKAIFYGMKMTSVSAYPADADELLQTIQNGQLITVNISKPGDWKITSPSGDQYFLSSEKFEQLYELHADGKYHPRRGQHFRYIHVEEKIRFMAPWGTMQYAYPGDALVQRGDEIYAINSTSFKAGYQSLGRSLSSYE
jgi:hypothetical protein